MKNHMLATLLFLLSGILAIHAQDMQINLDHLDAYYSKVVTDWDVPSMTVGIVKDGELIFSKGYGTKEIGKPEKPDEHTLYAIASNSKAFTSAVIAMLVEEGK